MGVPLTPKNTFNPPPRTCEQEAFVSVSVVVMVTPLCFSDTSGTMLVVAFNFPLSCRERTSPRRTVKFPFKQYSIDLHST